eukprot:scaffold1489_cov194-Cylindrotheca_fusiformis.AAC.4
MNPFLLERAGRQMDALALTRAGPAGAKTYPLNIFLEAMPLHGDGWFDHPTRTGCRLTLVCG